jgi:DNA-binding response OmpR family regulator
VARSYIIVVGHGPDLERDDGAAHVLRGLGAKVRTLDLWDDPMTVLPDEGETVRALVVEAMDRPDLAAAALRALRREPSLGGVGALVGVTTARVAELDPALGFDDFILVPYVPAELYVRVRNLEWRRSEFVGEELIKVGPLVIDRHGHEVRVHGRSVKLTAREFALLVHLCDQRGRVVTRDEAIDRVWGEEYDGGARTVDIHVRRLRKKIGDALPLVTLRGTGYKLAAVDEVSYDDSDSETPPPSSADGDG